MKRLLLQLLVVYVTTALARTQDQSVPSIPAIPVLPPVQRLNPSGQNAPPLSPREPTFDVTFNGGKPQDLMKVLEKARNETTPVIIPANATDIVLPPFELRNVTLSELFNALNLLGSSDNWSWHMSKASGDAGSNIWVLIKSTSNNVTGRGSVPIYNYNPQPSPAPPEMKVQPIHVGYLLGKYKIEDLTTAIETGWEMAGKSADPKAQAPELKYHKDTELLLIKGYPAQISFVNELLLQLGDPLEKAETARQQKELRDGKESKEKKT